MANAVLAGASWWSAIAVLSLSACGAGDARSRAPAPAPSQRVVDDETLLAQALLPEPRWDPEAFVDLGLYRRTRVVIRSWRDTGGKRSRLVYLHLDPGWPLWQPTGALHPETGIPSVTREDCERVGGGLRYLMTRALNFGFSPQAFCFPPPILGVWAQYAQLNHLHEATESSRKLHGL